MQHGGHDAWSFDDFCEFGEALRLLVVAELDRCLSAQDLVGEELLLTRHLGSLIGERYSAAGDPGSSVDPCCSAGLCTGGPGFPALPRRRLPNTLYHRFAEQIRHAVRPAIISGSIR
ncbi:hypothetical protein [Nocardia sp. NPDC005366]|uniref:hypothetical protein n=1 Tax=Nocardia sp. NPDC005366 TaxID=3156878 RepID=UPI0033A635DA